MSTLPDADSTPIPGAAGDASADHYRPSKEEFEQLRKSSDLNYEAVFSTVPSTLKVGTYNVELDFHYLRFNGNGQPKIREMVNVIANHLVAYAIDATRVHKDLTDAERGELFWEANKLLRDHEQSGEAGELLLYFLMECALKAPQVVAKISLKTNPNVEVHGSDGIHARWNEATKNVELFFGEAKIYDDIYSALDDALKSIQKLHLSGLEDEIRILTNHYKHASGPLKDYILKFAKGTEVKGSATLNQGILIGYDWAAYQNLEARPAHEREQALRKEYESDHPRLWALLEKRLQKANINHVRLHVFFLPFRRVDDFRKAFHDKVFGGAHAAS